METLSAVLPAIQTATTFKVLLLIFFAVQLSLVDYLGVLQESAETAKQTQMLSSKSHKFDYIIVGGGAAGCVLANRLSENPNTTVLLLERSGDPNPFTTIPNLASRNLIIGSERLAYVRFTTPQKHACLASKGKCFTVTGKGLGGSTNINGIVYSRGAPQVFDTWAQITQNEKWKYENVLKFFQKSEDYHGYYQSIDSKHHSTGGEWYVGNTDKQDTSPALQYFFSAAEKAGHPFIDINNGDEARNGGYGHFDFYIKNGERWGTYKAFLKSILSRPNLHISRYSRVTKIHLKKQRATGVKYIQNGVVKDAHANKEVILSAGTFGSPELLLRSGIGPKEHLDSLDIAVHVDLPVGKTLIDHYHASVVLSINKTLFFYPEHDTTVSDVFNYLSTKTGYLAKAVSETAYLYTKSSTANKSIDNPPNLEIIYGASFGMALPSTNDRNYFSSISYLVSPKSTGDFKLSSKNINDDFLINPNYLSHPDDLDDVVEGLQLLVDMIQTSPELAALDLRFEDPLPACQQYEFKTTDYWRCYATTAGGSGLHFVGTCRMGVDSTDTKAVVDSELKVLGVEGLRVVDASVMPTIPNAHTTASTVMVAEMGSHFILADSS